MLQMRTEGDQAGAEIEAPCWQAPILPESTLRAAGKIKASTALLSHAASRHDMSTGSIVKGMCWDWVSSTQVDLRLVPWEIGGSGELYGRICLGGPQT